MNLFLFNDTFRKNAHIQIKCNPLVSKMSIQLDFLLGRSRSTRIRNGPSSLPPLGRSRSTRSSAGHKSHLERPSGGQISSLDRSSVDGHQKDQQSSGYSTIKDQLNEYDSLMDQPSGQNSQLKRSSGHDKSSLWLGRSRSARSGSDGVTMLNHSTIKYHTGNVIIFILPP